MPAAKVILLVDDELLIAMTEAQQLRMEGYEVEIVSSGEKAVARVNQLAKPVDLVLMDIDLGPGMDGTQAAQAILKNADIPILFLSSHTEPAVVAKTESITSYGYSSNNPINYTDPSGHFAIPFQGNSSQQLSIGPWTPLIVITAVVIAVVVVGLEQASLTHPSTTPSNNCSLADCFTENKRRVFSDNEFISREEFDEFLEITAQDIDNPLRTPGDPARSFYDTPFYDGGDEDKVVCIEGVTCSPQSGINYVAQGMYSAQTGETLDQSLKRTNDHNVNTYGHDARPDEI